MEKKIVQTYTAIALLQRSAAGWFFATYVIFLRNQGISQWQVHLLNVGFMTTNFLLDPFTSRLGDKLGQKNIFVWGQIFWGLGMIVYGFGKTFPAFLLAEIISGIGSALMSDALECWLRNTTNRDISHQAITRTTGVVSIATIPAAVGGSIIAEIFGLHLPWICGGICSFTAAILAFLLFRSLPDDGKRQAPTHTLPPILSIFNQAWSTPPLRFIIVTTMVSSAAFAPINMLWAPILQETSGSVWWLGLVWVGVALMMSFGSFLANRGILKVSPTGIALTLLGIGIPFCIASMQDNTIVITLLFLSHEIGRGAIRPILFTSANDHITDTTRSSFNGVTSTARWLGYGIGLAISGLLTLMLTPLTIWGLTGITLVLLATYCWNKSKCDWSKYQR
ncbi:MFS transporter [Patescibacteria group bacterium]|nr:MFS transporter [Patescibacteria group bacterium]